MVGDQWLFKISEGTGHKTALFFVSGYSADDKQKIKERIIVASVLHSITIEQVQTSEFKDIIPVVFYDEWWPYKQRFKFALKWGTPVILIMCLFMFVVGDDIESKYLSVIFLVIWSLALIWYYIGWKLEERAIKSKVYQIMAAGFFGGLGAGGATFAAIGEYAEELIEAVGKGPAGIIWFGGTILAGILVAIVSINIVRNKNSG